MNPYVAAHLRQRGQLVGAMGYRNSQLVGYGPSLVGAPAGAMIPLMGQNPGSAGTAIVPSTPDQTRLWILPFPATLVGAGGTATQSSSVQVPLCRPNRIIMTETVAGSTSLTDLQIGTQSQFIAAGSCPIATFGPTAVDTLINFDTATTGQSISLFLANPTAGASTVTSTALCTIAK